MVGLAAIRLALSTARTVAGVGTELTPALRPRPVVVGGACLVHEDLSIRGDELAHAGETGPLRVARTLVRPTPLRGVETAILRGFLLSHGEDEIVPLFRVHDDIPSVPLDGGVLPTHPGNRLTEAAQGTEVLLGTEPTLNGLDVQREVPPTHLPPHASPLPEGEENVGDPIRSVDSLIHRRSLGLGELGRIVRLRGGPGCACRLGERGGHHRDDDGHEETRDRVHEKTLLISKKTPKVTRP